MRYSKLPTAERLSIRNKFNVWGNKTNSFVRPFQDAYTDIIQQAVDLACDKRVSHIAEYDERRRARHQLSPVVYGFGDDNIQIYVLPASLIMQYHGAGDVAVLHLKKEPYSHVVIYGETMKRWLDMGVADFVIPAKDVGEELQDIVRAWIDFSQQNLSSCTNEEPAEKLANMMKLYDPAQFVRTYLYPISQGFSHAEDYEGKLKEMLLNSPLPIVETGGDNPSLFAPIPAAA